MKAILNVTYSIPKYSRLICFYIINILFLEDNVVMHLLNKDEKKKVEANKLQIQLLCHWRKPYTEQVDLIMSNARHLLTCML